MPTLTSPGDDCPRRGIGRSPPGSGPPAWRPGPAGCPRSARGPVSGRLTTDRDVAGRFQDRAGPPHVGPIRDRPGSPRGQVRRRSRVRRCRRTARRTRPLRLRRPKRRSSETHPSALACSDISCQRNTLGAPRLPKRPRASTRPCESEVAASGSPRPTENSCSWRPATWTSSPAMMARRCPFRCSRRHHHHLVCRSCGYAIEITGRAAKRWADAVAERHGYADISHTLEVFGLCPH
jgi:hypothetical protein